MNAPTTSTEPLPQTEKHLRWIITWGSALGGGAIGASLQAYQPGTEGIQFHFSLMTAAAYGLSMVPFLVFWKLFFAEKQTRARKNLLIGTIIVLIGLGLAGIIYPLRFVASEKLPDVIFGLVLAAIAITGVGGLLYASKRLFD